MKEMFAASRLHLGGNPSSRTKEQVSLVGMAWDSCKRWAAGSASNQCAFPWLLFQRSGKGGTAVGLHWSHRSQEFG